MSSEFEQNLEKYADIVLKVGINLQKGQRLLIGVRNPINRGVPLELAPFVRIIVRKAYQMGARLVDVIWDDPQLRLIRFQHAPRDSFEEFAAWRRDAALDFAKKGDALLVIGAQDPELFTEQDPQLIITEEKSLSRHYKPLSDLVVKMATNWTFIAAPVDGWTDKVFPDLPSSNRKDKLWDKIFDICRVKEKDPVSAWNDHINHLTARINYLNNKQYKTLKLKAPGTDLTIGLPLEHIWKGGRVITQNEIDIVPNIPTEEIFTMPHKDKTEGFVTATKPLYYRGSQIEDFQLTFSRGRVIEAIAVKGKEFLDQFIETDEGASRIGEVALVPHSSIISQSGLLFYNGLIDENASNHIALGRAYKISIKNGEFMSDEEFMGAGGNISLIHMDFMIGSGEMDVDGIIEDGKTEPIMRRGEWAFEV